MRLAAAALQTLRRPACHAVPVPSIGSAKSSSRRRTSSPVRPSPFASRTDDQMSAAAPATIGAAIDVPLM